MFPIEKTTFQMVIIAIIIINSVAVVIISVINIIFASVIFIMIIFIGLVPRYLRFRLCKNVIHSLVTKNDNIW